METEEVILTGLHDKMSIKRTRILYYFMGIVFIINGIIQFILNAIHPYGMIIGILTLITGVGYLIVAFTAFSARSKYAPKVKVNDDIIELKNGIFNAPTKFNWSDIKAIELKTFRLDFQLANSKEMFTYRTTSDISINIKNTLRAFAKQKGIEVSGG